MVQSKRNLKSRKKQYIQKLEKKKEKKLPFFFNGFPELMERVKVGETYGENFFGGLIFCLGEEKK